MTPPEYRGLVELALAELAEFGVCDPWEKEYVCKNGRRISVMIGCALFEGVGQGGVAFVLDISDRKRAEASLQLSESQFRALFENANDAVLIANDNGEFVDANPAACELLSASYKDIIGMSAGSFTAPENLAPALITRTGRSSSTGY